MTEKLQMMSLKVLYPRWFPQAWHRREASLSYCDQVYLSGETAFSGRDYLSFLRYVLLPTILKMEVYN